MADGAHFLCIVSSTARAAHGGPRRTQEMFILSDPESVVTTRRPAAGHMTAVGPKRTAVPKLTTTETGTTPLQGKSWAHPAPTHWEEHLDGLLQRPEPLDEEPEGGFSLGSFVDCL